MSSPIHPTAAQGFDREADAYERGRPGYPSEATGFLIETLDLGPGRVVADIAAGTGKLTRILVDSRADVIAIEPVGRMREILVSAPPTVRAVDGTAEHTGLADQTLDAICVAQAFHWFDGPRATAEMARILRPGAGWRSCSLWEPHRGDTPTYRSGAWQEAFTEVEPFAPLRLRSFTHEQHVTVGELLDRVVSVSFIAALPESEREDVARQVRRLAAGRTRIVLPYRTDVFWTEPVSARRAP